MACRWRSNAVVVGLLASGCVVDSSGTTPLLMPDRQVFSLEAGPILSRRCGDYACHGNSARPYALYAVSRRRLNAADQYSSHPLTSAEWDANFNATRGFLDAPRGRDTALIQKALSTGGAGDHKGGAIFAAPSDPECQAILAWIDGVTL